MSNLNKDKIKDRNTRENIRSVEKSVQKLEEGPVQIYKREITKADITKLSEQKIYIDQRPDGTLHLRIKRGTKLYHIQFTES